MSATESAPKLTALLRALREREAILQNPGPAVSSADLEALIDPHFRETGASGRHYSRAEVLQELARRSRTGTDPRRQCEMSELHALRLAQDTYLLTYLLHQPDRLTRRSSIWRRSAQAWTLVYHQGTLVPCAAAGT